MRAIDIIIIDKLIERSNSVDYQKREAYISYKEVKNILGQGFHIPKGKQATVIREYFQLGYLSYMNHKLIRIELLD